MSKKDRHVMELLVAGSATMIVNLLNRRRLDAVKELIRTWSGNYLAAVICIIDMDDDGKWYVHESMIDD